MIIQILTTLAISAILIWVTIRFGFDPLPLFITVPLSLLFTFFFTFQPLCQLCSQQNPLFELTATVLLVVVLHLLAISFNVLAKYWLNS